MIQTYKKQNSLNNKGFSLVEILVYIALLIVLLNVAITTLLSLDTVLARNQAERALNNSATITFEKIVRDIRVASSVDSGLSTLGTSPGALVLNQGATTTSFYIATGTVAVSVNGVEKGPLTTNSITIDSLIFTSYSGTNSDLVRIQMTLSVNTQAASSTRTYYTSAVLRSSYD